MAGAFLLLLLVGGFLFFVSVILPLLLWTQIKDLQRIVGRLQKRLDGLAASREEPITEPTPEAMAAPAATQSVEPADATPPPIAAPIAAPIAPPRRRPVSGTDGSLEAVIAGRWLNRIGLLLVFLAVAYFVQWSIDNDWIGPTGQIALGFVVGAALLISSQWLLRRGYAYFSEGMTGLGAGVLYLALWAGCNYYSLFSQTVGFVAMVAVTAAVVAIAVGRDSQRIAGLALVGGFLTPALASSGRNAEVALFTYVALLNAGLLAIAWKKSWRWLELPAFVFTLGYFWGWYDRFYRVDEPLLLTLGFATVFFIEFSSLSVIRSRRTGRIRGEQALLVLLNGPFYLLALLQLLYDAHRWAATFATLALAAAHLLVLRAIPQSSDDEKGAELTRLLFAGLALTFVTLVIPIRLEGKWISMAFVVEGAVLMWTGFRAAAWQYRAAAFLLFAVVAMRLLADTPPAGEFIFNERFATLLVTAASFGAALFFAAQHPRDVLKHERPLYRSLVVATNLVLLWALSAEAYDYFSPRPGTGFAFIRFGALLARQLALSIVWTIYAMILIVMGVRRDAPGLRWQALVLFGVTVLKVFFYDMSFLRGGYRVASSIVLGLVLLAVSFLYQRQLVARKPEAAP